MVFSSTIFLFAFLPAFLAIYFAMPKRTIKNVVLLVFSLLFYAWGEPVYVWLMVFSIAFNWAFGYLISKSRGGGQEGSCLSSTLFSTWGYFASTSTKAFLPITSIARSARSS